MDNPFKKLFTKTVDSVLGVDIGPSSIKVVQLKKKKGRAVLETYGALALGPYADIEVGRATHLQPDKIAEALIDLLRESSTTTKKSGLSIPMSSSLVVPIEVPAVDEKQLAQIIPLEARKYIPIPVSEASLDWWIIPKEQSGIEEFESEAQQEAARKATVSGAVPAKRIEKMNILLVVIHNEAIAHAQEIVKLSGLDTSFFEIEIFSVLRAVLDRETDPVMILDLGAGSTKMYIVDRGILRISHIITRGSQDLTLVISQSLGLSIDDAEALKREKGLALGAENIQLMPVMTASFDYVFSEANRTILNYQKKYNKNLNKVVLTGGGAGLRGFLELAKKEFQTEVVLANPFAKVEAPAVLENVLREAGPEFSVAVGLALRKLQELG
jgi:type IV pilus assembly protein PilM